MLPDTMRLGDNITLQCRSSCQLSSVVWFKDGQPLTKLEFQAEIKDAGSYVCAVKGQESLQSEPLLLDVQCKYVYYTT